MKDTILFPFRIHKNIKAAYIQAVQMAEIEKADLILYTTVAENASEEQLNDVYFYLLELNKHYQNRYNHWKKNAHITIKSEVHEGSFLKHLNVLIQELAPKKILVNGMV